MASREILRLYVAKGSRVLVSAMLSLLIGLYLSSLHYTDAVVGAALASILAGNMVSNLVLTYFEGKYGKRRILLFFSMLTAISGFMLALTGSLPVGAVSVSIVLVACFMGNISTTGTEAGPFQSVEAGVLPELAKPSDPVRAFGRYNLIGYAASAAGSLAAGTPGVAGGTVVYEALFVVYGMVGLLLFVIYRKLPGLETVSAMPGRESLGSEKRQEVGRLSVLFGIDAFGGGFVSQYVLSYWFHVTYGIPASGIGVIFSVTNVIVAFSVLGAAAIATRLGNLRTMVYTHLVSNIFLIAIPLAGSVVGSLAFLFLRQSLSQMDVPTRQALMAEIFGREERVAAFAITNTARTVATFAGSPVSAVMFAVGQISGPILTGGVSKVVYDIAIFVRYRKRFR